RVAALFGDRVAQAGEVDQGGLAEDVVADHARGEPGEVDLALAIDQLAEVVGDAVGIGAADDVLGVHARGVGQGGPGAGADRFDGFARVEPVELRAGEGFAVLAVHGWPPGKNSSLFLPPLAGEVPEGRWGRAEGASGRLRTAAPTPTLPRFA